jgi:phosphatidylinositol alpha-1,6-mannosyltransferase
MRILLVAEVFPPQTGGSGRWLCELYRRLPGSDVHVVAGRTAGAETFDAACELPVDRLPLRFASWGLWDPRGSWSYARAFVELHRIVSRVRPDMIHCGKCLPEGLLALAVGRWHRIPFHCYAHGEELTLARTSRELERLSRRVFNAARRIIANSHFTKQMLLEEWQVPASKVAVMHPGVDTGRFVPAPRNAAVREQLGWGNRRVILTVGALQRRKGQDTLIRALPAIRRRCPDVLYVMAGEGWERDYLQRLAADQGVGDLVQFRGVPTDDELIQCYQQCDLFALPNRRIGWDIEGFGIVLLEAQACGKAVIAGMSGGTGDTLEPGVTGHLVPGDDPNRVAEVVVSLMTERDRAERMGREGRQFVVERFDWSVLRQQALELFGGAASG